MTLYHIDDFEALVKEIPNNPWPWEVVGVLPTRQQYEMLGDTAYGPDHAFCYTVSPGPTEVWCPMQSVEGRFCPPELITGVLNVIFAAIGANQLGDGDNVIVPFEYADLAHAEPISRDAVFWVGTPTEDPDNERYHCYASPNRWVIPVRWSSPEGWDDPE